MRAWAQFQIYKSVTIVHSMDLISGFLSHPSRVTLHVHMVNYLLPVPIL